MQKLVCLLFGHRWGRLWQERVVSLDDDGHPLGGPRWMLYRQCKRCGRLAEA